MQDGKYVILCVDDDADVRENVRTILEANDYIMVEASTAEEGLDVYKESDPDFLLVDLMMEEVDAGTNFAREMKLLDNKAPVYMLSSVGDALSQNIDYHDLGLAGVLQKPITPNVLLKTLKKTLS
jgi:DNA-binding response OmpR family regulator